MQSYAEEVIESKNPKRNGYRNLKISREGITKLNNQGYRMCIDRYETSARIYVRFLDSGYVTKTTYGKFVSGQIRDPHVPSVFGIGFLGDGRYKSVIDGKMTKVYATWHSMLTRCYSEITQEKYPTYKGCSVSPEWHNFQNFAKWYEENYYEVEGERMSLDKDILQKSNKLYCPQKVCIIPQSINSLFTFSDKIRTDLPIGVCSSGNKYIAKANFKLNGHKSKKHLGTFDTPEEAFFAYKEYKENLFKSVADEYKGMIPENVYDAMYNWKIEITD